MKIDISEKWLPVYQALASDVRLKIIRLVAQKPMNIKELAEKLGLSSAILTMHVKKLEKAGIITTERIHQGGAVHKICALVMDSLVIDFPSRGLNDIEVHEFSLPVGHYTDFEIFPTCGLATPEKVIGYFDDPRCFLEPERVNCGILWFARGFVEYRVPNRLLSDQKPRALEISLELGSEAPGINNNWPSDISFYFNGVKLGSWTSPGDYGGTRGRYTPEWWSLGVGQYGLLKVLRVDGRGSYIDGKKCSDITIEQLRIRDKQWTFRVAVPDNAAHIGGATIFGSGFGNYDQDIVFRLYYVNP